MNKSIMMGRLVRDPDVRYTEGKNGELAIANFRLAVDRKYAKEDDGVQADFFACTMFGKRAEFAEKYLFQGIKIIVQGHMQNDNYTNRDGDKVYGVRLIVEDIDFAESKSAYGEREEENAGDGRSGRRNAASSDSNRSRTGRSARSRNPETSGRRGQLSRSGNSSGYAERGRKNQDPDDEFMDMDEYSESDMGFH